MGKNKYDLKIDSIEIRNLIENIKEINFHQKRTAVLTDCVLNQCADLLSKEREVFIEEAI